MFNYAFEPLYFDALKEYRNLQTDKPLIALTMDWRVENHPDGTRRYACRKLKFLEYSNSIVKNGGVTFITMFEDKLDELIPFFDGILISGGRDIHPKFYGQEVNGTNLLSDDSRYIYEFELFQKSPKTIPMLGICWGEQFLNVAEGGSLIQHIPTSDKHAKHMVECRVIPNTLLYNQIGDKMIDRCTHHQAVDKLAEGYKVSSVDEDGIIHAIEKIRDGIWRVGIQSHPEHQGTEQDPSPFFEKNQNLFKAFIEQAKEFKRLKGIKTHHTL